MYKLQLFDTANPAQPIDARLLAEGRMTVGRDPRANWSIEDPDATLSRWHCELAVLDEGLAVRAVGANGVFLEGEDRLAEGIDTVLPLPCTLAFGRFRLFATHAPFGDQPVDTNLTMVLTPPVGASMEVPVDWEDAVSRPEAGAGSLLEAFCHGAGLDSSMLTGEEPEAIMHRAGAIYRQMVLGIGDLMKERDHARSGYELSRTTIGGKDNNPFKWAPTQRLALDLLLSGPSSFLSGPAAVETSFRDLKRHLVSSFAGLKAALRAAVEAFSPAQLESAASQRTSLLKSRASAQIDVVREQHDDLLAQLEEGRSGSLDAAFVKAYAAADSDTVSVQATA